MPKIFEPNPAKELRDLLRNIHTGEMALPDFQRSFVWKPRATEELLVSILRGYPVGSILLTRNNDSSFFAPRRVTGAPDDGNEPEFLVLDGQQRLTSLYHALYGRGDYRYFVDMWSMMGENDMKDCVFYEDAKRAEQWYGSIDKQAQELVLPFSALRDDEWDDWKEKVEELHPCGEKPVNDMGRRERERMGMKNKPEADDGRIKQLKEKLRGVRKEWFAGIESYPFPVITLLKETSPDAICAAFETLNRTGTKLSPYDLLAAKIYPEDVRLRDMWKESRDGNRVFADFHTDRHDIRYHIIQAVALYAADKAGKTLSCRRKDILNLQAGQVKDGWFPVVGGIVKALEILRDECGVANYKYLPYATMLAPAGAVLAKRGEGKGRPGEGRINAKIKQWFWCAAFSQAYDGASNSQAEKDYRELDLWIGGGNKPAVVSGFDDKFKSESLRKTTFRQRARYNACLALILSKGALDFYSGSPISAKLGGDGKVEDHHIFPTKHRRAWGIEVDEQNCILNRTLIAMDTNRNIGTDLPAEYLDNIEKEWKSKARVEQMLASQMLPRGADSPLRKNKFEKFLAERQKLLADAIIKVTRGEE